MKYNKVFSKQKYFQTFSLRIYDDIRNPILD